MESIRKMCISVCAWSGLSLSHEYSPKLTFESCTHIMNPFASGIYCAFWQLLASSSISSVKRTLSRQRLLPTYYSVTADCLLGWTKNWSDWRWVDSIFVIFAALFTSLSQAEACLVFNFELSKHIVDTPDRGRVSIIFSRFSSIIQLKAPQPLCGEHAYSWIVEQHRWIDTKPRDFIYSMCRLQVFAVDW